MHAISIGLQAFIAASIFFVWGVRYENIVTEFKEYRLPDWLRDFVGIAKITCAILLLIGIDRPRAAMLGSLVIALLMGGAFVTHLRVKSPFLKMLPCVVLLFLSLAVAVINYRILQP
ncbi:MAG: DoxX family protein [Verrucomicrobiota bacterium]|nr:DoxX family protein [Verrucomicrobiota bacterium]